jgi:hypothetical protein
VKDQFEGSQEGNRQVAREMSGNPNLGSTYNSDAGNPGDASRTRLADRYGVNKSGGGPIDMNDSAANGNGVVFDGVSPAHGMRAGNQPQTLDSPVPVGAQRPAQDAPRTLDNLRSGVGKDWSRDDGPKDSLLRNEGVMDR